MWSLGAWLLALLPLVQAIRLNHEASQDRASALDDLQRAHEMATTGSASALDLDPASLVEAKAVEATTSSELDPTWCASYAAYCNYDAIKNQCRVMCPAPAAPAPAPAAVGPDDMESNFKQIGEQFAEVYYKTYDSRPQGLWKFYGSRSLFTFEGVRFQGTQQITQKLASLPFQQVEHQVSSCHCQPVPGSPDKVILLVTGIMLVNGNQNVFTELFQLMKAQTGGWFILNDTFKRIQ